MKSLRELVELDQTLFEMNPESYYFITDKGTIGKAHWFNNYKDQFRKLHGNVYKDYRTIKVVIDNIKDYLSMTDL